MVKIEEIEQLAKRRGFFWLSSELYGGLAGFYDYGPVGTLLKNKLENLWRRYFLGLDDNFFEIHPSDIMHENVFEASGHVRHFVDPTAKCRKCGAIHRADHIMEDFLHENFEGLTTEQMTEIIKRHRIRCPKCKGELLPVGVLNMMFPLIVGPEHGTKSYLRAETAQGVYVNFLQNYNILRKKLPLGLAIIGKAYRNEISPRQLITRMREFTQAELQIFFNPMDLDKHYNWNEIKKYKLLLHSVNHRKDGKIKEIECEELSNQLPRFYIYYMAKVQQFFLEKLNVPKDKLRFKELSDEEKAHYNKIHWDIEINLSSIGWKEIAGVHYRTDYDLSGHQKISKTKQEIFFDKKKFVPHVLEISFGIDRLIFSVLDISYKKSKDTTVLKLPISIAPFTAAVFPLVNKDGLNKKAREVYDKLKTWYDIYFDDSGSIGRRYARADEIGVPFCITIDHLTIDHSKMKEKVDTVTIRYRDTKRQEREKVEDLSKILCEKLYS